MWIARSALADSILHANRPDPELLNLRPMAYSLHIEKMDRRAVSARMAWATHSPLGRCDQEPDC
jgi:hypothetical protein